MEQLLMKQFAIDLNATLKELNQPGHLFKTGYQTNDMRYWARERATMLFYRDRIMCRTDNKELTAALKNAFENSKGEWFGEMKNLRKLEGLLKPFGYRIKNYAPFFIPNKQKERPILDNHLHYYGPREIKRFKYDQRFSESFCYSVEDPDKIGVSYIIDNEIVAMAGANHNGKYIWEIGIEIIGNHHSKGIATTLVKALTQKILQQTEGNIIPTYGTQFTHTKSINVAIRSGYKLGWTEIMLEKFE